jgi:cytochrome c oxidase subunit 3
MVIMQEAANAQRKKMHPHKFTMWLAIGTIIMLFAGLTSAYIVKRNQPNWNIFELPKIFYYSTAVILFSSLTLQIATRYFKERAMKQYRIFICITALLGTAFITMQFMGFQALREMGLSLDGNVAGSFIYVIAGTHAVHVLGGVIALIVIFLKAFFGRVKSYSSVPLEVIGTYWHFVDVLWIYLFVFLMLMR